MQSDLLELCFQQHNHQTEAWKSNSDLDIYELKRQIKEIKDSLESIHFRMDKYYAWAAQLQKEYRDMQQRMEFIESNAMEMGFKSESKKESSKFTSNHEDKNETYDAEATDAELLERIFKIKCNH